MGSPLQQERCGLTQAPISTVTDPNAILSRSFESHGIRYPSSQSGIASIFLKTPPGLTTATQFVPQQEWSEPYRTKGRSLTPAREICQRHTFLTRSTVVAMHDPIYKRLFDSPRMVADLLRAVGHGDWLDDIDLGTLEKQPGDRVGDRGQQRRGDAVWRARFRNGWLYLLVVLEFQSANDPRMALRNLEYTALLYQELGRRGELGEPGRWPPVLPVVLYNGDARWTAALEMRDLIAPGAAALSPYQPSQRSLLLDERHVAVDDLPFRNLTRAVVGFEQSRTPADIAQVAAALRGLAAHAAGLGTEPRLRRMDPADGRAAGAARGRAGTRGDPGGNSNDVGRTSSAMARAVAPGRRGRGTTGRRGARTRPAMQACRHAFRRCGRRPSGSTACRHRGRGPTRRSRGTDRRRRKRAGPHRPRGRAPSSIPLITNTERAGYDHEKSPAPCRIRVPVRYPLPLGLQARFQTVRPAQGAPGLIWNRCVNPSGAARVQPSHDDICAEFRKFCDTGGLTRRRMPSTAMRPSSGCPSWLQSVR